MKFHPRLAPIKAAIFPLVNKDGMPEKAEALYRELKTHFNVLYDDKRGGRPALPPAGRGRHAVLHHHRRRHAARTTPSPSATATRSSSGGCRWARCWPKFARRWSRLDQSRARCAGGAAAGAE